VAGRIIEVRQAPLIGNAALTTLPERSQRPVLLNRPEISRR